MKPVAAGIVGRRLHRGRWVRTPALAAGLLLNIGQNRPYVIARESFEY